jgi:MGT family glycosyltransferase
MSQFLLTAWPLAGHTNPTLAVACALRKRGHGVAFYTGESARSTIEQEGFRCFPFKRVDEEAVFAAEHPNAYAAGLWKRLNAVRQMKTGLRQWLVDTIPGQVEDLTEAVNAWRPDVLVAETGMWGPFVVMNELVDIPIGVFSTFCSCLLAGPDAPAWGRGEPRPRNERMRLRSRVQRKIVWWLSSDFRQAVNAVRQRYGLPPITIPVTELAGRMPLYLMPSTRLFDYDRHDLPPSVHYVGPCSWDKASHETAPEWLGRLPAGRPIVHVTEATIHRHEPFLLRASAQALADLPVHVVMTSGRHRNPAALGLGPLPPNIQIEEYVPHSDLLPRVAVMVTLGGAGTVFAALKSGIPLVVVPTEWDKPENAQRVVEAGVGLRLDPAMCTPGRLREAVSRVLTEPSFARNAQRLAKDLARYGGADQAAELLEDLAARKRVIPQTTPLPATA